MDEVEPFITPIVADLAWAVVGVIVVLIGAVVPADLLTGPFFSYGPVINAYLAVGGILGAGTVMSAWDIISAFD